MNAPNDTITLDRLKEALHYDPETGVFTWLNCGKRTDLVGTQAGSVGSHGHLTIKVDGLRYAAHRLAFFYMSGHWPTALVDHKDGDPANNRWVNLRDASHSVNQQNQRTATSRNLWTTYLGVHFHKASGKYEANITVSKDGKKRKVYLGLHKTPEEAHAAYLAAKRIHHEGNQL